MEDARQRRIEDVLAAAEMAENLPSPKGVALELLRVVASEETTAEDLAKVIETDPAISARLLKAVNAPVATSN